MTHNHSLFRSLCTQRWTHACSLAPEAPSFWLAFQGRPAIACTCSSKYSVQRWVQCSRINVFPFLVQTDVGSDDELRILPWQHSCMHSKTTESCLLLFLCTLAEIHSPTAKFRIPPFSKGCCESGTNLIFLHRWGGKVDSRRFVMVVWDERCPFSCFRHFFGFGCHNHSNSLSMYVAPARRWSPVQLYCAFAAFARSSPFLCEADRNRNVFSFPVLKMFYPFPWSMWVYNRPDNLEPALKKHYFYFWALFIA